MHTRKTHSGFTLVEIAIVLLIVGLLTRTLIEPIAIAQQRKNFVVTSSELLTIKDSLHAHLVAHGYLPCPIADSVLLQASTPVARVADCSVEQGLVPAAVLGLSGAVDSQGALLDAWNRPYRYAVSLSNHPVKGNQRLPDWTTAGEASNVGLRNLSADFELCIEPSRGICSKRKTRAKNLAFLVLSHGQDDSSKGAQVENQDGDKTFVINELSIRADSPFDDQIVWSSTQDVLYWMLRAGWLP